MRGQLLRTSVLLLLGCLAASRMTLAGDATLSLADLEAYQAALSSKPDISAPAVRFRDLWDNPEKYARQTVTVEGRVARLFRQPKLGEFPALVEAWIVSTAGDPICLVFPQVEGKPIPEVGATIHFSGTFLKRIDYRGGDVARLAPLLVGPQAPSSPGPGPEAFRMAWSSADWMLAAGACVIIGLVLARRHFSRPVLAAPREEEPPSFVDGHPEAEGDD